ncbi:zinc finger CCCH domain-containing protein 13-like [Haliotis asinina]|uniref:zinc finger CCCH domain-containing protein 13-like n=1 Tax=Haliotis asinina TaxID=109174 RepID=UPI003531C98A
MSESTGRDKNRDTSRKQDRGNAGNARPSKAEKGSMNNQERDSNVKGGRYASGRRGSKSPPYGSSKEPTNQGRQSHKYDNNKPHVNDEDDDWSDRDPSPTNNERDAKQANDKSRDNRGRWKEAGDDQLRKDRRKARQDRMVMVMELFEDSLIIDKVALKDRQSHIESVVERLEELKRAYAQKLKEEVTAHWAKVTEEGRASRADRENRENREESARERQAKERSTKERPARVSQNDPADNKREQRDNRMADPPRVRPRAANSGQMFKRDKSRIMSGEMTQRGKREASPENYREKDDVRESPKHKPHPRAVNSGDDHNRGKNRVNSGDAAYRS